MFERWSSKNEKAEKRRKRSRGTKQVWGLEKLAEKCKLKQGDTWKKPKRTSNRAGACQTRRVDTHERLRIYLFLDTSSASSSSSTSGQVSIIHRRLLSPLEDLLLLRVSRSARRFSRSISRWLLYGARTKAQSTRMV